MKTEELIFKVAGTPYDGRQDLLRSIYLQYGPNQDAELCPEDDNPYDRFAVGVWTHGKKIGYVPRNFSKDVYECMKCLINSKIKIFPEKDLLCAEIIALYGEEE